MKIIKTLFGFLCISLAFSLTCREDKKCCQIVKAERFYGPVERVPELPKTYISSHHLLLLTIEDETTLILELDGNGPNKGKDHLICSTAKPQVGHDYSLSDVTKVLNRISVSKIQQYCDEFLAGKKYNWISHLDPAPFLGAMTFLGAKSKEPSCLNCITLADYLWEKLMEKSLSYLTPLGCS